MEPVAAAVRKIICRYTEGHPTKRVLNKGEDVLLVNEVVRLSDAEARIKALEADVQGYRDNNDELATAWASERARAEAAEALLKEAGEALDGMLQYAGIIEERCGNVETVLARRAARAIHHKIGVKDE